MDLIAVLGKANFTAAKIISDDMSLLSEIPNESIHPSLKDKHKEYAKNAGKSYSPENSFEISGWNTEIYKEEIVDEDIKQLGIKYKIDTNKNASFMTYTHWKIGPLKEYQNLSKRKIAQTVANC